jgi:hypothetical protein
MSGALFNSCDIYESLYHRIIPSSLTNTYLPTPDVCHCFIDCCFVDLLSLRHDFPMRSDSGRLGVRSAEKEMYQHIALLLLRIISQHPHRPCSLHFTTAVVLETRNLLQRARHSVHAFRYGRFVSDLSFETGTFIQY